MQLQAKLRERYREVIVKGVEADDDVRRAASTWQYHWRGHETRARSDRPVTWRSSFGPNGTQATLTRLIRQQHSHTHPPSSQLVSLPSSCSLLNDSLVCTLWRRPEAPPCHPFLAVHYDLVFSIHFVAVPGPTIRCWSPAGDSSKPSHHFFGYLSPVPNGDRLAKLTDRKTATGRTLPFSMFSA